jgi:hypothetical protein
MPPDAPAIGAKRIIAEADDGQRLEVYLDRNDPIGAVYKGWDWIESKSKSGWVYVPENSLSAGRTTLLSRRGPKDANVWIKPWH